jgi:2'-5' RNA ligase
MSLRTFIAVPVPTDVQRHLARLHESVPHEAGKITWVKAEAIHLTCLFLGEIETDRVGEIGKALREAAGTFPAFETCLGEVGAFPNWRQPRVVWVGLEKGEPEAITLKEQIEAALVRLGFPAEKRPFHPHITLGRVRSDGRPGALDHAADRWIIPFEHWMSREAILFRSELTPQGPVYTPLLRVPLKTGGG